MTLREALDLLELNERTLEQSMLDTSLQNRLEHTELRHVLRVFEAYRKVNAFLNPSLNTQGDARVTIIDESVPGDPSAEVSQATSLWAMSSSQPRVNDTFDETMIETSSWEPFNPEAFAPPVPVRSTGVQPTVMQPVAPRVESPGKNPLALDSSTPTTVIRNPTLATQASPASRGGLSALALMGLGAAAFGAGVLVLGPLLGRAVPPRTTSAPPAVVIAPPIMQPVPAVPPTVTVRPGTPPAATPAVTLPSETLPSATNPSLSTTERPAPSSSSPVNSSPPATTAPVAPATPQAAKPVTPAAAPNTPVVSPVTPKPQQSASPKPVVSSSNANTKPVQAAPSTAPSQPKPVMAAKPKVNVQPSTASTPRPVSRPTTSSRPVLRNPVSNKPKPVALNRAISSRIQTNRTSTPRANRTPRTRVTATAPRNVAPKVVASRVAASRTVAPPSNRALNQNQFTRWDRSGAVLRYRSWALVPTSVRALSPARFRAAVFVASSPANLPGLPR